MNEQEMCIAIAEKCGWKSNDLCWWFNENSDDPMDRNIGRIVLPDYCNDLNACHEMEKALDCHQWPQYIKTLAEIVEDWRSLCHATAAQRAEAFCKTLGIWKEDQ